jgi:hypothetical protein
MPRAQSGRSGNNHQPQRWSQRLAIVFLWAMVAWGVLAFGGVYAWAYQPLLIAAATFGAYGWFASSPANRRAVIPLTCVLITGVGLIVMQLIPMTPEWLLRISPGTDRVLADYNLPYRLARLAGVPAAHPLSIAPGETQHGLLFLLPIALFTTGCVAVLSRVSLRVLVGSLIPLALAIAVFAIIQKATFNGRVYWVWTVYDPSNTFGPFVNRNHFAGWMLMATTLSAGYLCGELARMGRSVPSTWRQRAAWASTEEAAMILFTTFALLVMSISVIWSFSRSGIIGLTVGLLLLAGRASSKIGGGRGALVALTLIAFVSAALAWRGFDSVFAWYGHTNTLEWRLDLWRDSLPMVRDFPWFGTGLNTYGVATNYYEMTDKAIHAQQAHNDYLQLLVEGGVALTAIALAGVAAVVAGARRALRDRQESSTYWIRTGAICGLCGIAVQELTDFSLQLPGNTILFALLIAIVLHRSAPRVEQAPTN